MKEKVFLCIIIFLVFCLLICAYSKTNFVGSNTSINLLDTFYTTFKYKFENVNYYQKLKSVDKIYCIVMPQRKEYMKKLFDTLKINYTFFNAITPSEITEEQFDVLSSTNNPYSKLYKHPTRLALQLAYTICFLDAIKKGYSTIIVFEDDITVNVDLQTIADNIENFKNSNFVFFYMGYCWMNCKQHFRLQPLINVPDKQTFCAHAICYKVKYLQGLINDMYPMNDNFDNNLVNFVTKYNYDICVPPSTFFDQNREEFGTLNDDDTDGKLPECNSTFKNLKNK